MTDNFETRILRVSLLGAEPEIWRVFEAAGIGTLGWLHESLIGAMGWGDCHLHSFTVAGTTYSADFEGIERIGDDEEGITVSEALPEVGSSIYWLYDWGDGWEHTVTVVETGTMQHGVTYPILYDGARTCPLGIAADGGDTWTSLPCSRIRTTNPSAPTKRRSQGGSVLTSTPTFLTRRRPNGACATPALQVCNDS